jgi:hypothetical protein
MRFPTACAFVLVLVLALNLGLGLGACSTSTPPVNQCAPNLAITASGTLQVERGTANTVTEYALSTAQAEDLFNSGSLTITADETDGGLGTLAAGDPVVLVNMQPSTDTPGSYDLTTLAAQIAYCPTTDAKLVVANGALTGCAPSGTPVTGPLQGTLTVTSASSKTIATTTLQGGAHTDLQAAYGAQNQQCN